LTDSIDWSEWNRKLKNYLSMIELWKILIEDSSELTDPEKHLAWSEKQEQLEGLLGLILGTSARSLIERITGKNATQQLSQNSLLMRAFRCLVRICSI
jgi:hypothetical protein